MLRPSSDHAPLVGWAASEEAAWADMLGLTPRPAGRGDEPGADGHGGHADVIRNG
ncbi:hypothetical protein ACL02T_24860 [Pseudonocardia sp. RS010]|uniref:hypothetical protein n=1 Tax=Pseudonocardia sp. RS010 TaxID=3385979 RepID=UPI0039A15C53